MALTLPSSLIQAKNELASTDAALVLCEIDFPALPSPLRLVANEADITWNLETWVRFPFEITDVGEPARGELPQVSLRVSNVTRAIQGYVDQADGGLGATVKIYVIDGGDLPNTTPFLEMEFTVGTPTVTDTWVTFPLTSYDTWAKTFPKNRVLKNHCAHSFKGLHCGYAGVETLCNRTLTRCRELNNSERFGGFPGVGSEGVQA